MKFVRCCIGCELELELDTSIRLLLTEKNKNKVTNPYTAIFKTSPNGGEKIIPPFFMYAFSNSTEVSK